MVRRFLSVRSLLIASYAGALFLSGCAGDGPVIDPYAGRQKREEAMQRDSVQQADSGGARRDVLQPAMTAINTRIAAYSDKLQQWQDIERKSTTMGLGPDKLNRINECRANLEHVLLEYNALQQQLQGEPRVDAAQLLAGKSLLLLNQQDIEYLESGCGNYLSELQQQPQRPVAPVLADPQIKAAYDNADFDQVINLYAQSAQIPGQRPALETTYQYAQALLKNHQQAEAAKVVNELLAEVRQQSASPLLLPVLQLAADLAFTQEAYDEARRQYEEVVKVSIEQGAHKEEWAGLQLAALQPGATPPAELRDFGGLLKSYLAYVPKRDGFTVTEASNRYLQQNPYTRLGANVNALRNNTRSEADAWLNRGVQRVESSVGERQAQTQEIPPAVSDAAAVAGQGTMPQGAGTGVAVPTTTNATPAPQVVDEKSYQEDYDRGLAHFQAKEYEKALERFNRLQHTAYATKVQPMVTEASKQAAQEVRQKAAELFVRASNSRDTEEKRKLLISSRDLLQSILTKYPQSGISDKVQRNLARIESDLRGLESSSAPRPVSSGGAYVPPKTGAASGGSL